MLDFLLTFDWYHWIFTILGGAFTILLGYLLRRWYLYSVFRIRSFFQFLNRIESKVINIETLMNQHIEDSGTNYKRLEQKQDANFHELKADIKQLQLSDSKQDGKLEAILGGKTNGSQV